MLGQYDAPQKPQKYSKENKIFVFFLEIKYFTIVCERNQYNAKTIFLHYIEKDILKFRS